MLIRKLRSYKNILQAVTNTNRLFDGNIRIASSIGKGATKNGLTIRLRLGVHSSRRAGARRGLTGRRIAAACWHAHGVFFDELLKLEPQAVILTAGNQQITAQGGNWVDRNIGSIMKPFAYSEACDCEKNANEDAETVLDLL